MPGAKGSKFNGVRLKGQSVYKEHLSPSGPTYPYVISSGRPKGVRSDPHRVNWSADEMVKASNENQAFPGVEGRLSSHICGTPGPGPDAKTRNLEQPMHR